MTFSVYQIVIYTETDKRFYIGYSKDVKRRAYHHEYYLNMNKHDNALLQKFWNENDCKIQCNILATFEDEQSARDMEEETIRNFNDHRLTNIVFTDRMSSISRDNWYKNNLTEIVNSPESKKKRIESLRKHYEENGSNVAIPLTINGVDYASGTEASLALNIPLKTVFDRVYNTNSPHFMNWNIKGERKEYKTDTIIFIDGIMYYSCKHASSILNIEENTIYGRVLSTNPKFRNYLSYEDYHNGKNVDYSSAVWIDGHYYNDAEEYAKLNNLNGDVVRNRIRGRNPLYRNWKMFLEKDMEKDVDWSKAYFINNFIYYSVRDVCERYGMTRNQVHSRVLSPNFPTWHRYLDAVERGLIKRPM